MTNHTNRAPTPTSHLAPVTPGRRGLLGGAAALLAGAAAVALPGAVQAAGAGPVAELIRLCNRVVANRTEWLALVNSRYAIEDEKRPELDIDRLNDEGHALLDQIEAAPDLRTMAGAAALADAPLGLGGHWEAQGDYDWLALTVAEYLAQGGIA